MNSNCLYMKKFNLIIGKMEIHGTTEDQQSEWEKEGFVVAKIGEWEDYCRCKGNYNGNYNRSLLI